MHARAMIKAGGYIIVAGAEKTDQLLNPGKGGMLTIFDSATGKPVVKLKMEDVPVFDGMAAANGRLFISGQNGKLGCFR